MEAYGAFAPVVLVHLNIIKVDIQVMLGLDVDGLPIRDDREISTINIDITVCTNYRVGAYSIINNIAMGLNTNAVVPRPLKHLHSISPSSLADSLEFDQDLLGTLACSKS